MSEAIDTRSPREIAADAVIQYAEDCGLRLQPWQADVIRTLYARRRPAGLVFPHRPSPGHPCYLSSLSRAGLARRGRLPLEVRLGLPGDHSTWARSVRWSCGRPGYVPVFDWGAGAFRADYDRALLSATIIRADRVELFRISAV